MPFAAHRNGDTRTCGASTVVVGQTTVFVNNRLWAVEGDINSHGSGNLVPVTGDTIYIEDKLVIVHGPDNAFPDDLCPIVGEPHCAPLTASGSGDTSAY
jgi:uncharacterized Zn-binding protein involved in type VI secretion